MKRLATLLLVLSLLAVPVPASAAPSPQALTLGAVIALKGTPHIWILGSDGKLHWGGDTRALAGKTIDWNNRREATLDELKAAQRGDPWLSSGLVKIGDPIYLSKWESDQPAPTLLHIQSIADVELFGISSANYGAMVIDRSAWQTQYGFNTDTLTKASLASASPVGTTRENPVPLGQSATFSDGWRITVLSTTPNATSAVLANATFNRAPATGSQYFMARIHVARTGSTSSTFFSSLPVVGASNVAYSRFSTSCGSIPDPLPSSEIFPGGSIQGNVCWAVSSSDAASVVMYYDPSFSSTNRVYFALR